MFKMMYAVLSLVLAALLPINASSIGYSRHANSGITAHVVTINLADPEVRVSVALAEGGAGRSELFKSLVARTSPVAAITGTFFDTKTLLPTGDIGVCGTLVYSGCIGSALCIDSENNASIVSMHTGRKNKWAGYETVLCAGPTLISNGKIAIALKHEGFRPSLLTPARRTAIGITQNGKLLLVAINRNVSLYDTAKLMLSLNVVNALCLDGGSSTGLYYAGSFFAVPSRKLTNCIVVYSSKKDYDIAKTSFAPRELLAKADIKTETSFEQKSFSDSLNWLPQPPASNLQTNFFIREPAYSIRCLQMQRENLTLFH